MLLTDLPPARRYWLQTLLKLFTPVLEAAAERRLHAADPFRANVAPAANGEQPAGNPAPLGAVSRALASISPWLELTGLTGEEAELQERFRNLARAALASVLDPGSPDHAPAGAGSQVLVETAKLSQSVLYARRELWEKLDASAQANFAAYVTSARVIRPHFSNWLLFAATNEAALCALGLPWDRMRVDYALRQHEQWYLGDGVYGDGPEFHFDYYNSLVIHPLLLTVVRATAGAHPDWDALAALFLTRARRHVVSLERLISPEGTFPPIGRSLAYRCGVFHALAHLALLGELPPELPPAQVRAALTAVVHRSLDAPGTFTPDGRWLQLGFAGAQPGIAEPYLTVASSYLCGFALLPLGCGPDDEFWRGPDLPWTAKRAWGGEEVARDKALV